VPVVNEIAAAGAVVWRRNANDEVEIALIHRVKYDDWSIPKGKVEGDESLIACAYRETMEETGFDVRFGPIIGSISYSVGDVPKTVTYWSAKFLTERSTPNPGEVDEIRWMTIPEAHQFLTRELDKKIITDFLEIDLDTKPLILLRHAKAIERNDWAGEDTDRPLSSHGERQARRLLSNLQPYAIEEMHSSSAVRCYETITPMARSMSIDFFFTDSLSEDVFNKDRERPVKYIHRLLVNDYPVLACSHNPILPEVISSFVNKFGIEVTDIKLEPGDAWVAHHIDREVVSVEYLQAPRV
jgi:8-oxo-dGTP pyrophosphatase MutT (NUDIX family)/phosphohistidine phosphatase SixA